MATLNFDLQNAPEELYDHDRWNLLTQLILHANPQQRCWPSTHRLMKRIGRACATVLAAKEWLLEHEAIRLVPFEQRISDAEKALPVRQHIYELTGYIKFGTKIVYYLYINKIDNGDTETSQNETSNGESFTECYQTISKEDSTNSNKIPANAGGEPPKPKPAAPVKTDATPKFPAKFLQEIDHAIGQCFFGGDTNDPVFYASKGSRIRGVRKAVLKVFPDTHEDEICKMSADYFKLNPDVKELKSENKITDHMYDYRARLAKKANKEESRSKPIVQVDEDRQIDLDYIAPSQAGRNPTWNSPISF